MTESIKNLDDAISKANPRPKGIKVGTELWKELKNNHRVKWARGYLKNMSESGNKGDMDSEIDFPVIDEDIFVHVESELDYLTFELPPNS